jgi:hypothetical protein
LPLGFDDRAERDVVVGDGRVGTVEGAELHRVGDHLDDQQPLVGVQRLGRPDHQDRTAVDVEGSIAMPFLPPELVAVTVRR